MRFGGKGGEGGKGGGEGYTYRDSIRNICGTQVDDLMLIYVIFYTFA